jgi:hypothetical protein
MVSNWETAENLFTQNGATSIYTNTHREKGTEYSYSGIEMPLGFDIILDFYGFSFSVGAFNTRYISKKVPDFAEMHFLLSKSI